LTLDRTQPILPMLPGTPERATHNYQRHGTSSLYAALGLTTGKVIGRLHNRHRAIEFHRFLQTIDQQVPKHLDVHLVLDNSSTHKTPKIRRWLAAHPRFHLHFTPTSSSWINLVERWFAELTNKRLKRAAHRSVRALSADIRARIETWNENPRPYVWTKPAERILESIAGTANESTKRHTSPLAAPRRSSRSTANVRSRSEATVARAPALQPKDGMSSPACRSGEGGRPAVSNDIR
jgi:transposase